MRRPLFIFWAAFRWVLLMFLIVPVMDAPLVAHLSAPVKPIKTWVGNSSWYGPGFNGKKTANGERFDCEVLGLYEVRDRLLYRAQMFYFDSVAVRKFLQSNDIKPLE